MEVKIMEWNIHQQGRWGKRIPLWILDEIPQDINILTLTEFNGHAENIDEFYKKIKAMGFYYCNTNYSFKSANDILIAVRGKEIRVESVSYFKAYADEPNSTFCIQWKYIPENLRVDITVRNKPVTILGIRIKDLGIRIKDLEIDYSSSKIDYSSRKIEMKTVMKWVKEITNPIVILGDFNNLHVNTRIQDWNLKVLDYLLGEEFIRKTPANHSWGLQYSNGQFDGYIKNDHLICKNISEYEVENYSWNFVSNINYQLDDKNRFGQQKANVPVGDPDHGILFAKIKI